MIIAPVPVRSAPADDSERGQLARLLDGELLDLYIAILIVVPVALFLKSLWF
jgi:hypothetical protein